MVNNFEEYLKNDNYKELKELRIGMVTNLCEGIIKGTNAGIDIENGKFSITSFIEALIGTVNFIFKEELDVQTIEQEDDNIIQIKVFFDGVCIFDLKIVAENKKDGN